MGYRLTTTAEEQLDALLLDSVCNHGFDAAGRYGQLILTVMIALGDEPHMIGSIELLRLAGARA